MGKQSEVAFFPAYKIGLLRAEEWVVSNTLEIDKLSILHSLC